MLIPFQVARSKTWLRTIIANLLKVNSTNGLYFDTLEKMCWQHFKLSIRHASHRIIND